MDSLEAAPPPRRVLVSYADDDDHHVQLVGRLVDWLTGRGVSCMMDHRRADEQDGTTEKWTTHQIIDADAVLIVCSRRYRDAWNDERLFQEISGPMSQIRHVRNAVSRSASSQKFIPVIFSPEAAPYIPDLLAGFERCVIGEQEGYDSLWRRIRGVCTESPGDLPERVTTLLSMARNGDTKARDRLAEVIYRELRQVAANRLRSRRTHSLDTTELVSLAYERLLERKALDAVNRRQLFAIFKCAMNELLIDQWRAQSAKKRGGDRKRVPFVDLPASDDGLTDSIPLLLKALEELAVTRPQEAEVVSLRYLCGLSLEEVQELMGLTLSQVRTKWDNARRWLYARIKEGGSTGGAPN